ncbi:hypothetical protein BsWGS_15809 [Bradybaena similaris]
MMEHETANHGLEFVIDKSQAVTVEAALERIAALFHVRVEFKNVFAGSKEPKQWISVVGTENEIVKAKEYILALVSPAVTIQMRNICGHPLFTPTKEEEIERTSAAVLSKRLDDSLMISGTELTVILAQSMVDDLFSKTIAEVIYMDKREASESNFPDTGTDVNKQRNDKDELRSSTSLNRNNSALTSVASQSSSASTMAGTHYTDSILKSDLFANANRNAMTASEQQSASRPLFPHELSLYASASAIYPGSIPGASRFGSDAGSAQRVFHTANHAGDGAVPKTSSRDPSTSKQAGQVGYSELSIEGGKLDTISRMGSQYASLQARDQETYLRNLGQSLHYAKEDIEKGLADYSMENIVKPAEFLKTLNRIKAQRHGGGHPNVFTGYGEKHGVPQNSAASHHAGRAATEDTLSRLSVNDYIDLDASVICMGSASADGSVIVVSSEDELDENDESMSDLQVAFHPPPTSSRHTAPPLSELQSTFRKNPTFGVDREATMTNDSSVMGQIGAFSQRPTGQRNLRYIIIDGSNVAMAHGNNKVFSVEGLRICINYFLKRGHDRITAFVPEWRRYSENQTLVTGRALLEKLHDDGYVKFTPARRVNGRVIASYDDRFILNLAEKEDGIVVSNDQFRDLCPERASYQNIVAERLLQFMFVEDHFMPPDDPLGRHGPHLDEFLRYPEIEQRPAFNTRHPNQKQQVRTNFEESSQPERSKTTTFQLYEKLCQVFPEPNQGQHIMKVLDNHKCETDLNRLTNYCMNSLFS